jgi:hypothetical protein
MPVVKLLVGFVSLGGIVIGAALVNHTWRLRRGRGTVLPVRVQGSPRSVRLQEYAEWWSSTDLLELQQPILTISELCERVQKGQLKEGDTVHVVGRVLCPAPLTTSLGESEAAVIVASVRARVMIEKPEDDDQPLAFVEEHIQNMLERKPFSLVDHQGQEAAVSFCEQVDMSADHWSLRLPNALETPYIQQRGPLYVRRGAHPPVMLSPSASVSLPYGYSKKEERALLNGAECHVIAVLQPSLLAGGEGGVGVGVGRERTLNLSLEVGAPGTLLFANSESENAWMPAMRRQVHGMMLVGSSLMVMSTLTGLYGLLRW